MRRFAAHSGCRAAARARHLKLWTRNAYFEFAGVTVLPWIRRRPNLIVSTTHALEGRGPGGALRLGVLFARADIADARCVARARLIR